MTTNWKERLPDMKAAQRSIEVWAITAIAFLTLHGEALAQSGGPSQLGQNLGNMLAAVGGAILLALAGIMALGLFGQRKNNAIAGVLFMVVIIGGLFWARGALKTIIISIYDAAAENV